MAKLLYVDKVAVYISGKESRHLMVNALGRSISSGWTGGILSEWHYLVPPDDGILDFDFFATPPSGDSMKELCDVTASTLIECPDWCKGVRVHASANVIEENAILVDDKLRHRRVAGGGDDPWPWLVAPESVFQNRAKLEELILKSVKSNQLVSDLVGRQVRILRESDRETFEYIEGRVNIVLADDRSVIKHIYMG